MKSRIQTSRLAVLIVAGTVVEELGPQWGPESMTGVEDQAQEQWFMQGY